MSSVKITEKYSIGGRNNCFIIAEIGQNHQGNLEIAKELIKQASISGADCVKFQKMSLTEKFNKAAIERKYESIHSFGATYGEHKKHLEFTDHEFMELQKFSEKHNIIFTATPTDMVSLDFLMKINVPFIKIGSGDSNNLPLIRYAASKYIPLLLSTGMINQQGVHRIYDVVSEYHKQFCLLHCVSSYPSPYDECNLNVIKGYQEKFPDVPIGYSGHETGITVSLAAVALGAKIVERHLTLDKYQKGSDHICSLNPQDFKTMVEEIRVVERALGSPIKGISKSEQSCINKLQKSLVMSRKMQKGEILQYGDLKVKVSEPKGMDASLYDMMVDKTLARTKSEDETLFEDDVY